MKLKYFLLIMPVCVQCAFTFETKLDFSLLNFCSLIIDHDASQGLRYSLAHHSSLPARHDQADAGAGLDPRPALLPAPGQHREAHLLHFLLITSNQINLAQSTHFHCYSLNLFSFRASSLKSGVTHCSQSTNSAQPSELLTNGNRLECACLVKL